MQRFIMTATVLFGLALGLFVTCGSVSAGAGTPNCSDFVSRAAAQQFLDDHPNDPYGLDGNPGRNPGDDGIACENENTFNGPLMGDGTAGVPPTATTAPIDPTATSAPVDPTATLTPGEPSAVATDEPTDPTAAPVDPTQEAPIEVPVDNGGTDGGTSAGAGTMTGTSSGVALPNTGTGDVQSSSMTTMTLLLALFAGACLALGAAGLLRRRG